MDVQQSRHEFACAVRLLSGLQHVTLSLRCPTWCCFIHNGDSSHSLRFDTILLQSSTLSTQVTYKSPDLRSRDQDAEVSLAEVDPAAKCWHCCASAELKFLCSNGMHAASGRLVKRCSDESDNARSLFSDPVNRSRTVHYCRRPNCRRSRFSAILHRGPHPAIVAKPCSILTHLRAAISPSALLKQQGNAMPHMRCQMQAQRELRGFSQDRPASFSRRALSKAPARQ